VRSGEAAAVFPRPAAPLAGRKRPCTATPVEPWPDCIALPAPSNGSPFPLQATEGKRQATKEARAREAGAGLTRRPELSGLPRVQLLLALGARREHDRVRPVGGGGLVAQHEAAVDPQHGQRHARAKLVPLLRHARLDRDRAGAARQELHLARLCRRRRRVARGPRGARGGEGVGQLWRQRVAHALGGAAVGAPLLLLLLPLLLLVVVVVAVALGQGPGVAARPPRPAVTEQGAVARLRQRARA
jgi:hypothetical protein